MSSFKDTTIRQLSSFVHQKLYATAQDILGQVEKALGLAVEEADKTTLSYHVLTPVSGTNTTVTGVNLQQIMATLPPVQEPHFGLIGEIVPKTSSEEDPQMFFLKESREEKEIVSRMNVMGPFCDAVEKVKYQTDTGLSEVLQCVYSRLYSSQ